MTIDLPRDVYASSESKEWYTPADIAERARELMGAIDLDPASSDEAQQTIRAAHYFTVADDGLAQPWRGRVFLNPPYGKAIRAFVDKLLAAYAAGDVSEAIAVLPARPDTRWFQPLYRFPLCFRRGRVTFNKPGGQKSSSAPFPTVIVYLGPQVDRFCALFGEQGQIQRPSNDLISVQPHDVQPLAPLLDAAQHYAEQSRAPNTKRAYQSDWQHFASWCEGEHARALPAQPATVAAYIAHLADAGRAVSTIGRRLASISQAHQLAGYDTPTKTESVRTVLKGIRRAVGAAQKQAAPATTTIVKRMIEALRPGLAGHRDRALLLIGFAGAFRRSELVALQLADVTFTDAGLVIIVRRSKTDQAGQGRELGIAYGSNPSTCPVRALRAWLNAGDVSSGALFRGISRAGRVSPKALSDRAVALLVKQAAERAGLDPKDYSGHSLRAGLATSAAERGASYHAIKAQTGHKSDRILQRYIRSGSLFNDNASALVGL